MPRRTVLPCGASYRRDHWSYNCASLGSSGNFIVSEDGGSDFSGASVNELGPGGHGVTHVYGDAGVHYLGVDSECSWGMKAVSLP